MWGIAELTFLDGQNQRQRLSLHLGAGEQFSFQMAIDRQLVGRVIDEAAESPRESALGKSFLGVKEIFRDETRDNICTDLRRLGIDAKMVTRGRVEEEIRRKGSLGIIHIPEGAIPWVNVCRRAHTSGEYGLPSWYTEYGVPDPRLGPQSP